MLFTVILSLLVDGPVAMSRTPFDVTVIQTKHSTAMPQCLIGESGP